MEDQLLCFIIQEEKKRNILKTDMNDFSQKNLLLGNPIQAFRKLVIISAVQKDLQLNDCKHKELFDEWAPMDM